MTLKNLSLIFTQTLTENPIKNQSQKSLFIGFESLQPVLHKSDGDEIQNNRQQMENNPCLWNTSTIGDKILQN